jgi:predicted acylesterase/phospholipase RssA
VIDGRAVIVGAMVTRIAMMLPGAVSLGAYEGGALAALLTAVQASDGELVIDAIASASAGSMTGLLAGRALLSGADPVELMRQTWVVLPQLQELETDDMSAPLTMDKLMKTAEELLGTTLVGDGPSKQAASVRLSMALTLLGGLSYAIPHLRDPKDPEVAKTLIGTTYVDFFTTELEPGATTQDYLAVLNAAMASGSTPVGFPPRILERDDVAAEYRKNGVLAPPGKPFSFWYSDGGDMDNQPFGRLLDLIEEIPEGDGDGRVIVMLNIEPGAPPTWEGTWFDLDHRPSWLSTLLHVNHIRTSQSLYDDLRRLEKTNRHIAWIRRVASSVEGALDGPSADVLSTAVGRAASEVAGEREDMRKAIREAAGVQLPDVASPVVTSLEGLLLQAAGLDGKREVVVEVISPEVDPSVHLTADQQLSGEFLFHFGGFFEQKYRESDFALGYRNARYWLGWWLAGRVADPALVLRAVDAGYDSLPSPVESYGDASVTTLSKMDKARGVGLLRRVGEVVAYDLALDVAHELEHGQTHRILDKVEEDVHFRRERP